MNIFVAKLNYATDSESVRKAFEQFGEVESANVVTDRETGRSKGFAFVEMPDDTEGNAAIQALDGTDLDGRTIVVKKAEPRESRGGGGGGFNGGGGGGGFKRNFDNKRSFDRPRRDDNNSYGGGGNRNNRWGND